MQKYASLWAAFFFLQSAYAVQRLHNCSHKYPICSTTLLKSLETSSDAKEEAVVRFCSASSIAKPSMNPIARNLLRGAFLRVASDLTGGTPLENIKTRVATTTLTPVKAAQEIVEGKHGFLNLWSGTPGRVIEGAMLGGIFMVGSTAAKKQVLGMGGSKTAAALAGGIVGGIFQSSIMTPSTLVFTSLNVNKGKQGHENDNSFSVAKRIIRENGIQGMYIGVVPMAARQATNWASRSLFTEICRTSLKLSRFGSVGEIASGVIGGVSSCWNTPLETVRVLMQRDASSGVPQKTFNTYVSDVMDEGGVIGLYRGVSPRALQATWQTVFMVVVPNILGV